ncbi:MAG: hypothetical protein A2Y62_21935 [Candidatus Fischerbacteria bacterium RBG_13_37_8]|uniref:Transposase IS200-like domain-containing protein n=1 Tax=Candidatus Fischerbacteria bacterium RBG_13_37_8 TaxID=1817863 RepID=A0A1F5VWY9_9BACT|nr:MAG: hypothetical protein A2Y62_21935 [Candidatus Fischerbacteria bacterium RBG_13_37_8]
MSRQPRIQFEDAVYHIMARGVEQRPIFWEKDDYQKFLELLSELPARFKLIIYCYVLMTNHYHLLVETPLANIGITMHHLAGIYASFFNRKYSRVGHLFQARFRSKIIDKDEYLLNASRYIHLNPLDIEDLSNLEDYEWSSYPQYIYKKPRVTWLNYEWILGQLSNNSAQAIQMYKDFLKEKIEGDEGLYSYENLSPIIGNSEFADTVIKTKIRSNRSETEEIEYNKPIVTFEKILQHAAIEFAIDENDLRSKNSEYKLIRKLCVYLARCYTDMSNDCIGQYFGIKRAAVSAIKRRLDKQIIYDNYLRMTLNKLINDIMNNAHEGGQE